MYIKHVVVYLTLDDQTLLDMNPAGQPEQASLNQFQLIAKQIVLWVCPVDAGDQISL